MPSFDRLAGAAVTPGGFQSGVNDIVQALLNRDAHDAQMAQARERQAYDRQAQQQQFDLQRQTMGSRMADQLADQQHRAAQLGLQREELDFRKTQAQRSPQGRQMTEADWAKFDEDEVNRELYGTTDLSKGIPYERDVVKTGMGMDYTTGLPTMLKMPTGQKETAYRQRTADEVKDFNARVAARRQARGNTSPSAQVVQSLTAAPGSGAAPTEQPPARKDSVGGQIAGSLSAQPAVVDYEAEDAKLQAADPNYKAARANPRFNWRKAIDALRAQGP